MSSRLIAHLAHVEVLSPKPEEALPFYTDVLGLVESGRSGQSIYLRAWGEWGHHTLQLPGGRRRGVGPVGWRPWSPGDLGAAGGRFAPAGAGGGWFEDSTGHGR